MNAMVVFDSKYGTTADVAARIAEKLGDGTVLVFLRDKGAAGVDFGGSGGGTDTAGAGGSDGDTADAVDVVVLGGPVYAGTWSKKAAAFARAREAELKTKTFAYFSVGAEKKEGPAAADAALSADLKAAAVASAAVGGAFKWDSMNFLERAVIKAISKNRTGAEPAIDEGAIDAFAAKILAAVNAKK